MLLIPAFGQGPKDALFENYTKKLAINDSKVRMEAVWSLGKSGDTKAIDPLIQALKDNNSDVREWSVLALVEIGKPAVDSLVQALKDNNSVVRG